MMNEDVYERLTKVETKVEEHDKKLNAQESKNETLTKLTILMERQMDDTKERERKQEIRDEKQNKQMESFGQTLIKVNENLTNLNSKQTMLDDRVTGIEGTLSKQSFSMIDVLKYLGATIAGLAVGYIAMKLGI
ncbi:hypothetical protein [Bacillus xiapuensis]|uniref:Uncharacterized protein n=1 Tax=Bacillus xiapuensis TaxID=2014075 RepID=A0ABU6N887_9BACI|nr:hypothetical protein [Bacillus xiapuensis]